MICKGHTWHISNSSPKICDHMMSVMSFPFFAGSYFAYRKVDVMRILALANSISSTPIYIDVGCGYGDFLNKIREFVPTR